MLLEQASAHILVQHRREAVAQVAQAVLEDVRLGRLIDRHLEKIDEPLERVLYGMGEWKRAHEREKRTACMANLKQHAQSTLMQIHQLSDIDRPSVFRHAAHVYRALESACTANPRNCGTVVA